MPRRANIIGFIRECLNSNKKEKISKKRLDRQVNVVVQYVLPVKGLFFVRSFRGGKKESCAGETKVSARPLRLSGRQIILWRRRYENKNYTRLPGVQAQKLRHNEREEERSGQARNA